MNNTAACVQLPTTARSQPARKANIAAIVAYCESGIKASAGALGIELEHTIVEAGTRSPVAYSGEYGVKWLLGQLREAYPTPTFDAKQDLLGVARPGEAITLEPAAQLELSAGPFARLDEAEAVFTAFEEHLARILGPVNRQALMCGYHPSALAGSLALIPKRRYKFMNFYFGELGPWGTRMMRGSASTQISIDYTSVADCLRKLRIAYALVPILSLITDNAPVFEGKPSPHPLMRTEIWKHCDPARCGVIPGVMDGGFSLRAYAEYLLDTPAILVPCAKNEWCYTDDTFGDIYAQTPMDRRDIEHALSMLFNDVRLKTYIEIRPADALPTAYVLAYAALVKGLFSCEETLCALEGLFSGVGVPDIEAAKEALMAEGYGALVYGQDAGGAADRLVGIARDGLDAAEQHYLTPLACLIGKRTTLAQSTAIG